ncbi:MAG: glycosyltransferase family 4 protein [Chloroflexi bacterium]|nr:glycosyltransferase family 4 protein [Chloroflexota bacterium]
MGNILYVTRPMVPPWNEGSQDLTWQIASALRYHDAYLLTVRDAVVPEKYSHIHWERPYTYPKLTNWQKWHLVKYLRKLPKFVDLIHFYFVPTLATSTMLAYLTQHLGIPSVQTVPSLPKNRISNSEAARVYFADKIVTYTQETTTYLQQRGIENVIQINVGIALTRYTNAVNNDKHSLRRQLELPEKAPLILYAGEYTRLGAVAQLQQIIPMVFNQNADCNFVFACRLLLPTDAGIKADLEKWVAENGWANRVHFLGEVPDFPSLLHASDIFVFPATDMTGKIDTPLTILQAMATGLPILAYEDRSLAEIFAEAPFCLLPNGDVDVMVAAIIDLVQNGEKRNKQGQCLRQIVLDRYDLQKMIVAYEYLYDSLL